MKSLKKTEYLVGTALALALTVTAGIGGYETAALAAPAVNTPSAQQGEVGAPLSFADIVDRVAPAVVSIDVETRMSPRPVADRSPSPFGSDGEDGPNGLPQLPFGFDFRQLTPTPPERAEPVQATGSGFFISASGYIVTNNHVVDGASKITVRMKDERSLTAKLVGRDPATDLAVIKVEGSGFPYVDFEERAKPRVGDWVIAVGNPFNLGGTATAGIVSALGRADVSGSSYVDYLQIDAPINRGNSGGPTFDVHGRVVGVNSAIFSPSGGSVGIGFDIPADVASKVARELIADGKVTRGYIGATIQKVTADIAGSLGLSAQSGALVSDLTPGGPAERAGLQAGDIVLKVNGHDVASASDLTRQVALARPGEDIRLQVRRAGQVSDFVVRSGLRPSEASLASNGRAPSQDDTGSTDGSRVLGMQLAPSKDGVAIQTLAGNSDAARKGLQPGDVIVRAGASPATRPADVAAAVAEAKKEGRDSVLLLVARNGRRTFVPVETGTGKAGEANAG